MVKDVLEVPLKTILYADDAGGRNQGKLQENVTRLQETLARNGLQQGAMKTKFLNREEGTERMLDCYGQQTEGWRNSDTSYAI